MDIYRRESRDFPAYLDDTPGRRRKAAYATHSYREAKEEIAMRSLDEALATLFSGA